MKNALWFREELRLALVEKCERNRGETLQRVRDLLPIGEEDQLEILVSLPCPPPVLIREVFVMNGGCSAPAVTTKEGAKIGLSIRWKKTDSSQGPVWERERNW